MTELQVMMGLIEKVMAADARMQRARQEGLITEYEACTEHEYNKSAAVRMIQLIDRSYTAAEAEGFFEKYAEMAMAADGRDGKCA